MASETYAYLRYVCRFPFSTGCGQPGLPMRLRHLRLGILRLRIWKRTPQFFTQFPFKLSVSRLGSSGISSSACSSSWFSSKIKCFNSWACSLNKSSGSSLNLSENILLFLVLYLIIPIPSEENDSFYRTFKHIKW